MFELKSSFILKLLWKNVPIAMLYVECAQYSIVVAIKHFQQLYDLCNVHSFLWFNERLFKIVGNNTFRVYIQISSTEMMILCHIDLNKLNQSCSIPSYLSIEKATTKELMWIKVTHGWFKTPFSVPLLLPFQYSYFVEKFFISVQVSFCFHRI